MGSLWRQHTLPPSFRGREAEPGIQRWDADKWAEMDDLAGLNPVRAGAKFRSSPLWIPGSASRPRNDGGRERGCRSDFISATDALALIMNPARAYRLGILLVTLSALVWSTAGLFTRLITVDTPTMLLWRGIFGSLGFFAYMVFEEGSKPPTFWQRRSAAGWVSRSVNQSRHLPAARPARCVWAVFFHKVAGCARRFQPCLAPAHRKKWRQSGAWSLPGARHDEESSGL